MSFLPSLSGETTLLDVFKKFPGTAVPLLEYHEILMRGTSPLSVAERELIAAYVSGLNDCQYCLGVHSVTAAEFGVSAELLDALLIDPDGVYIEARLRPLLAFVRKLTLTPSRLGQEDADQVFAAGWDEQALHDAVSICALFNSMNRIVDGLGIKANPQYSRISGKRLASGGYRRLSAFLPH